MICSALDWSNAKLQWANQHPMDAEERLVAQAQRSHVLNPQSKVFVYRNLVHADNWMTTVREKLDDPAYSGFFVPFKRGGSLPNGTWHVPACDTSYSPPKCSQLFHDQVNTPQHNPHITINTSTHTHKHISTHKKTPHSPPLCIPLRSRGISRQRGY